MAEGRTRRSITREIGNPITVFQGSGRTREKKWSAFRLVVIGLWIGFLSHWPAAPWGPWDWAALAVLAFAFPVADLFAAAPVTEGLNALAAIFGATVAKRINRSSVTTETETVVEEAAPAPNAPEPASDGAVG